MCGPPSQGTIVWLGIGRGSRRLTVSRFWNCLHEPELNSSVPRPEGKPAQEPAFYGPSVFGWARETVFVAVRIVEVNAPVGVGHDYGDAIVLYGNRYPSAV